MPNPPRHLLRHSYYHITARGNDRRRIFVEPQDYMQYISFARRYKAELPFDIFHYCLMPNHIHLLIQIKKEQDFVSFMRRLNLTYSAFFHKKHGGIGHLWQGRYHSQPVGKDSHFIQCGKYIELNPVRAGLVSGPEDYLYSSYGYYAFGRPDDLVTPDPFWSVTGPLAEDHQGYRDLAIEGVVEESYKKAVWGSDTQRYRVREKLRYYLQNNAK